MEKHERKFKCAVCAVVKDERRHLEEWIRHCLSVGFCHIHLYEDAGSEPHGDIAAKFPEVELEPYSAVQATDYDGRDKRQIDAFSHFARTRGAEFDRCAFIDPDEFIRFEDGWTLERLCDEFSKFSGVMLRQKTYGANGRVERPAGGLQENYGNEPFEYRKPKWSMKTIVNLRKGTPAFKGVHRVKGAVFTDRANKITDEPCYAKAWYDHYYTKSWRDWLERFTRRGDVVPGNVKIEEFFEYNGDMESPCHMEQDGRGRILSIAALSLQSGPRCVEVGVFRGKFSKMIQTALKPSVLMLVDPWTGGYGDYPDMGQEGWDEMYRRVYDEFGKECDVVRKPSLDAALEVPDGSLDFVYIDADHSQALADIRAWYPKVKKGGMIAGHDYSWKGCPSTEVEAAVREFFGTSFFVTDEDVAQWFAFA